MGYLQSFLIHNPLIELGMVTLILVISGYIMKRLKQPVLIGYILGGLLLGPQVFDVIHNYENIEFYAHFGVSLLLFMVGLGLNPSIIKEVGKVASIAGVGQVIFTSIIGFSLSLLLGFTPLVSLFIAIALTFSSTIIIVKLISDRGDAGTKYGKIALGILIVQDILAMLVLLVISSTTMAGETSGMFLIIRVITVVAFLLYIAWLASKHILPKVLEALSEEKELLLLFIITWAILLGGLRYYAGFSMEIGALLAGVTLASSRYRFHIFSELRPFRDFFLALFFVYLGGQIVFDNLGTIIFPVIIFSAFVLLGNPAIIMTIMLKLGYKRKESFMTGLTVAQISEFSFIIIGLALTSGIIQDPNILSIVTIVGLITMTGSSYMFAHADEIFHKISPFIKRFEKTKNDSKTKKHKRIHTDYRIVVLGYGRLGQFIATKLKEHQIKALIIDNDADKIKKAEKRGFDVLYGNANDSDFLDQIISKDIEVVYSTIDQHDLNIHILNEIKDEHPKVKVITTAHYIDEVESHYNHNADYVIFPHFSGATDSRELLEKQMNYPGEFKKHSKKVRKALQDHKEYLIK